MKKIKLDSKGWDTKPAIFGDKEQQYVLANFSPDWPGQTWSEFWLRNLTSMPERLNKRAVEAWHDRMKKAGYTAHVTDLFRLGEGTTQKSSGSGPEQTGKEETSEST